MSDSYDDYESKMQLAEHAWEVKTKHDRAVELGQAYERGWNAALAQREWVPEALRLADALDDEFTQGRISNHTGRKAAAELRRLHEVNQDLLEVLKQFSECDLNENNCATLDVATKRIRSVARAAIAKATGEKS
jgi:hypothetical protein